MPYEWTYYAIYHAHKGIRARECMYSDSEHATVSGLRSSACEGTRGTGALQAVAPVRMHGRRMIQTDEFPEPNATVRILRQAQ